MSHLTSFGVLRSVLAVAIISTASNDQALVRPLESGDCLGAVEFLRRYEAMPIVKKAELIDGTVYMSSPVSRTHSGPDSFIQAWLGHYSVRTPGTETHGNATVRLDLENVAQPDALLWILPECGGRMSLDSEDYFSGPPELIVEIAASNAAIDLHRKLRAYRRAAVGEYLVWRPLDGKFDWFVLDQDEYRPNVPASPGILRSSQFPGLVLAVEALLSHDWAQVLDVLQENIQTAAHDAFITQLAAKERK